MRAVRWHRRYDVRYEDIPSAPAPGPREVRVAVAWCGLCGTDVHEYRAGPFQVPLRPHPVTGRSAPIVLGHEVCGRVTEAGRDATGAAEGDLVALNALIPCGTCRECRSGDHHICPFFGHIGQSADGGLADFVTVPAAMAVPVPGGLGAEVAALAEPFAVAWHLVGRAGEPNGRRCAVIGAGSIGLAAALILRAGDNDVVVTDTADERLAVARGLGLAAEAAGAGGSAAAGADVVLECSGSPAGFGSACAAVRPGGLIGLCGLPESPVAFDVARAALREVTLVGSMSHQADADMRPALDFLAGHEAAARELITGRVGLDAAVSGGLDVLTGAERGRHIKILVRVGDGA